MKRNLLVFGIILLFVLSAIAPLTTGLDTENLNVEVDVELERMLDDIRFMCAGPSGLISVKYEYYKEQILRMYSSENLKTDVVDPDETEIAFSVESPSHPKESSAGPMDSPWPMFCHDVHHTGQSPYSTADNSGIEKWRFEEDLMGIEGGAVIDNNGIIYFGDAWGDLIALYPDGTEKWRYTLDGQILGSTPAIAEDGTIYIGSWDTGLYAINPDGTKKWRFGSGGVISSSPAIGDDGTIYCGHAEGDIFAMNPNGTRKWRYKTGGDVFSDPAIGEDGTIYCGSNDNYLYAMNPDGTLKWRFKTGKSVSGRASIGEEGTIYAYGTWDNYLYALYPNNGSIKWKCNIKVNSNPSIGSDGTIYIGGDKKLYAVYPNGTRKWTFDLGSDRWVAGTCPAISADGTIYVSTCIGTLKGGDIVAVNPDGTLRWRKEISDDWIHSSPSIAEDGTVFIGSSQETGGYLHAFGPQETNDPPTVPTITGPSEGKVDTNYEFTFKATDPDRNPVSFYIEWGDGETTGWTMDYNTGEKAEYSHTWSEKGNYTIRAKAKDTFGLEGDWSEFDIGIIKKSKATNDVLFWRLIGQFPMLHRLMYLLNIYLI
jgi:outer membrane protein assembly factor BamB